MCRIYGYLGLTKEEIIAPSLERASALQRAGGPDEQGYYYTYDGGIGANRLAIQGLDGGTQPYHLGDSIYAVFNGEIYNHRELRRGLESRGYTFTDNCDGSIIPAMYREYGNDFVQHLDGMFAIAVLDNRQKPKLTLAVDGMGIKPLFYNWNPSTKSLAFASEIPALSAFPGVNIRVRPDAVDEFMTTRVVFGHETMYEGINSLEPGNILTLELGENPKLGTYATKTVKDEYFKEMPPSVAHHVLYDLMNREVKKTLESDVPVSLIASGGVDSSILVAMAAKQKEGLHTFHVCSKGDWPMDERHYARELAAHCGTIHHEVEVDLKDFPRLIEEFAQCLGQPDTAPQSLGAFAMMKVIRDLGFKATIGGEGSDELFAGYDRIRNAAFEPENIWLDNYIAGLSPFDQRLKHVLYSQDYKDQSGAQIKSEMKARQLFGEVSTAMSPEERLERVLAFEQKYRLPAHLLRRADHISMASSVELRVPFCQPSVVAFSKYLSLDAKLKGERTKCVVYDSGLSLLPNSILNRRKQHFILPIAAMYRQNETVRTYIRDTLATNDATLGAYFDQKAIKNILQRDPSNVTDQQVLALWSVMIGRLTTGHVVKIGLDQKLATQYNSEATSIVAERGKIVRRRFNNPTLAL